MTHRSAMACLLLSATAVAQNLPKTPTADQRPARYVQRTANEGYNFVFHPAEAAQLTVRLKFRLTYTVGSQNKNAATKAVQANRKLAFRRVLLFLRAQDYTVRSGQKGIERLRRTLRALVSTSLFPRGEAVVTAVTLRQYVISGNREPARPSLPKPIPANSSPVKPSPANPSPVKPSPTNPKTDPDPITKDLLRIARETEDAGVGLTYALWLIDHPNAQIRFQALNLIAKRAESGRLIRPRLAHVLEYKRGKMLIDGLVAIGMLGDAARSCTSRLTELTRHKSPEVAALAKVCLNRLR